MTHPKGPPPGRPQETYGRALRYSVKPLNLDELLVIEEGKPLGFHWNATGVLHFSNLRQGGTVDTNEKQQRFGVKD